MEYFKKAAKVKVKQMLLFQIKDYLSQKNEMLAFKNSKKIYIVKNIQYLLQKLLSLKLA